jgi:uncharacterized membrane protein
MKTFAWAFILFGVVVQVFYSISPLFLPSMATADGVAAYPSVGALLGQFLYRVLPYVLMAVALRVIEHRWVDRSFRAYLAAILAVTAPMIVVAIAAATPVSAARFKDFFWPLRPVLQLLVFGIALGLGMLAARKPAGHRYADS